MDDRRVYLTITWKQAKQLLALLDALQVVFKSDLPLWVSAVRNKLFYSMYPGG